MSASYRKRPVLVEMVQWKGDNFDELEAFAADAHPFTVGEDGDQIVFRCAVSQSEPIILVGDWIAKETDGAGFYPISREQQAETYELAVGTP